MPTHLQLLQADAAYQALRQTVATRSSPLVAVVGSGLSAAAGLPTWPALKAHLIAILHNKAAGLDPTEARKKSDQAEAILRLEDPWIAFGRLRNELGSTTYTAEIRSKLAPGDTVEIPSAYAAMWRTPVHGVLTVNIDSLARRSFSSVYPGLELKSFTGKQAARLASILHGPHRFVYNLHGVVDDSDSWVFTHRDLRALFVDQAYKALLQTVFTTYTVLFLGISADDVAVGGSLHNLTSMGIQGPVHYWLTSRTDVTTDDWAEDAGIRVIRYTALGGNHSAVVDLLEDLTTAQVPEIIAPPVVHVSGLASNALPPAGQLAVRPLDEVRTLLNNHAAALLGQPNGEALFDDFMTEYDEAVHRAWYISTRRPQNIFFGNTLIEQVARGAYGKVFRAEDPEGQPIAIKVLLPELRAENQLLHSFRRGVAAMRILEGRKVAGMVAYKAASEIPAFVTMDWIEGPNLAEAKEGGLLADWNVILWACLELARILRSAHELPERVLHRDVRPANVMIRNGWSYPDYDDWELVVLDFDLSTFRGARQKSVLSEGSALGFLAPEQLDAKSPYSTRNAAVDSFGFGMTLLFLCSGDEPEAYSQRRADYDALVRRATQEPSGSSWASLPERILRLILAATSDRQPLRWDMPQILRELMRLQEAQRGNSVEDMDMLTEEVIARCPSCRGYRWDIDGELAELKRTDGLTLTFNGPAGSDWAELAIGWASLGLEERASLSKYIPERIQRAAAALRNGGWERVEPNRERYSMTMKARVARKTVRDRIDEVANSLEAAIGHLQFSTL